MKDTKGYVAIVVRGGIISSVKYGDDLLNMALQMKADLLSDFDAEQDQAEIYALEKEGVEGPSFVYYTPHENESIGVVDIFDQNKGEIYSGKASEGEAIDQNYIVVRGLINGMLPKNMYISRSTPLDEMMEKIRDNVLRFESNGQFVDKQSVYFYEMQTGIELGMIWTPHALEDFLLNEIFMKGDADARSYVGLKMKKAF